MNKIIISSLLLLLLGASIVNATSSCPCGRPGKEGTVVGFYCHNQTTEDVIFHIEDLPESTGEIELWALKDIDDGRVPIENLAVTLCLEGATIAQKPTDKNGYVSFMLDDSGKYTLSGGDANLSIFIPPTPEALEIMAAETNGPKEINRSDDSIQPDLDGGGAASVKIAVEEETESESEPSPENKNTSNRGMDPILAGLIVAIIALIVALLYSRKKAF